MHSFTSHFGVSPARPMRRLWRELVDAFHDINTAQRIMFESYQNVDSYAPDPSLHWEPGMPGWRLRGQYLPVPDAGTGHRSGASAELRGP